MDLIHIVVAILAVWRISHLLAREDGPFDMIARIRARAGQGVFGELMDCFNCISLWVAAGVALWLTARPAEWLFTWLGLSGGACLVERIAPPQLKIERLPEAPPTEGNEQWDVVDDGVKR